MENKYENLKNIRLNDKTYYFDGKDFMQEGTDWTHLEDVKDPKIISELEKIVNLDKVVTKNSMELGKNYEIIASRN